LVRAAGTPQGARHIDPPEPVPSMTGNAGQSRVYLPGPGFRRLHPGYG